MPESCLAYSILPAPAKLNWPIIEFRGEQKSVFISVIPSALLRTASAVVLPFAFVLSTFSVISEAFVIDYCPCFRRDDNIIDYFSVLSVAQENRVHQ